MCRPCPSQNGATPPWRGAGREQTAPYSAKRLGTLGGDNLPLHELRRNRWPIAVRLDLISFKHEPPYTFSHRLRHHHRTDQVAVSIQVRRQRRHASSWNANRTFSTTIRNHRRCTCGCWCDPRPSSRHHDASRRCQGSVGTPVGTAGRPSPSRALSTASTRRGCRIEALRSGGAQPRALHVVATIPVTSAQAIESEDDQDDREDDEQFRQSHSAVRWLRRAARERHDRPIRCDSLNRRDGTSTIQWVNPSMM
jgi:hypothetical protein